MADIESTCSFFSPRGTKSYFVKGTRNQTLTEITIERLLALMLGLRYRHVVTLRRVWVVVVSLRLSIIAIVIIIFYII